MWRSSVPEGAVVYTQVNQVAIVTAAPLAERAAWATVTSHFLEFCRAQKLDCLMLPVGPEFATVAKACGMALLRVGESGYFNLPEWKPAGDRAKKVRAGVNQARKAGLTVELYNPQTDNRSITRAEVEQLCQAWQSTHEVNALGWLLALNPFNLSEHKRYFLARNAQGELEGMLACCPIPARHGWYLEDLLRRPEAERGVSELLVVEALKHLAAEGVELATLGTSPLAGVKPEGEFKLFAALLALVYEHCDAFYHFKTLHRFKAKFAPSFIEPEYLAFYPPRIRLRMINALFGAIDEKGLFGLLRAKWQRVWPSTPSR